MMAGILIYGCSTKKNTFTRRLYHNLTGHYNMYWNGNESYKEGVDQLQSSVQDDYNKILPVFNYGTEADAQSLNSFMDRAIEKASINIQRHSMYFNRREYVRYIDDSYMLIGKSYFYKQEYNKARRTFEFVANEYKYNNIRWEATLWIANSYIRLEKYKRAQSILDKLRNDIDNNPKIDVSIRKMVPLLRADMFILQEKYNQAKQHLETALYFKYEKDLATRIEFILGQIYQREKEYYIASDHYLRVIKRNPKYEMAFNAAVNLAQCYDTRYGGSGEIEKKLQKMLREDKNRDFLDQIYYALADIAFKNGNDTLAIDYLRLSVTTSVSNNFQMARSALKLGDIYFEKENYENSQAYYDTAMQVLPEDYPNYKDIALRTESLSDLVDNLIVIKTEDSLQHLAGLSEDELNAIIDKIIEEKREEEERLKEMEEQMAMAGTMDNMNRNMTGGPAMGSPTGSGSWYFYNPQALSFGFTEFTKKWGKRKLEDLWRLSSKQTVFTGDEELMAGDSLSSDSAAVVSTDPFERETYLQNIPVTEEQMAASNKKIEEALFNLGMVYKDKLDNRPRSAGSFEKLLERYPENEYLLETYYHLHGLYADMEDPERAGFYKNLIIENFPESDYAKILTDPEYYKKLEAEKNIVRNLYADTYNAYADGQYYTALANSNRALENYEEPKEFMPKFEFIRALALGRVEVADSLQAALEKMVEKYPDSEVTPLAQNILDYIRGPVDTTAVAIDTIPEIQYDISIYAYKPASKQIFTLMVDDSRVNVDALKVRISDFNKKNYSLEDLSVTNVVLFGNMQLIMVGNFEDAKKAMVYYRAILKDTYVFSSIKEDAYDVFVLSQENYPVFYKDKDVNKYVAFFNKNYLEN